MKILGLFFALLSIATLSGCAAANERFAQGLQREMNGGYPATVKLYSLDGKLLETWKGSKVLPTTDDDGDPSLTFIVDGHKVSISGVYSIQEQ